MKKVRVEGTRTNLLTLIIETAVSEWLDISTAPPLRIVVRAGGMAATLRLGNGRAVIKRGSVSRPDVLVAVSVMSLTDLITHRRGLASLLERGIRFRGRPEAVDALKRVCWNPS